MIEYKITNTPNTISNSTFFAYTKTVTFFGVVVSCVEYSAEARVNDWHKSVDLYGLLCGTQHCCISSVYRALTSQLRSLGFIIDARSH